MLQGSHNEQLRTIRGLELEVAEAQQTVAEMARHKMSSQVHSTPLIHMSQQLHWLEESHAKLCQREKKRAQAVTSLLEEQHSGVCQLEDHMRCTRAQTLQIESFANQSKTLSADLVELQEKFVQHFPDPSVVGTEHEAQLRRVMAERDSLVQQNLKLRLAAREGAQEEQELDSVKRELKEALDEKELLLAQRDEWKLLLESHGSLGPRELNKEFPHARSGLHKGDRVTDLGWTKDLGLTKDRLSESKLDERSRLNMSAPFSVMASAVLLVADYWYG